MSIFKLILLLTANLLTVIMDSIIDLLYVDIGLMKKKCRDVKFLSYLPTYRIKQRRTSIVWCIDIESSVINIEFNLCLKTLSTLRQDQGFYNMNTL